MSMPKIEGPGDVLIMLVVMAFIIPAIAGVFLLEAWIGVKVVTLVIEQEFGAAYLWALLFTVVISMMGFLNGLAGVGR